MARTVAAKVLALVLFGHALILLAVPSPWAPLLLLALGAASVRVAAPRLLLLSGAVLLGATLGAALVTATGVTNKLYYRPHELLEVRGQQHYRPGASVEMAVPFGDLRFISTARDIPATPRRVRFSVYSRGYRNDREWAGETLLLVGDSIVVGTGITQEHTLPARLRQLGLPNYSIAFVGEAPSYADAVERFVGQTRCACRVALFLGEGTDFPRAARPSPWDRLSGLLRGIPLPRALEGYHHLFTGAGSYRLFRHAFFVLRRRIGEELVTVRRARGIPIAFFKPFIAATMRTGELDGSVREALARMAPRVRHAFFVPTKYRVYRDLLDRPPPPAPAGDAREQALRLARELGFPLTDLTPVLQAKAAVALASGKLLYWPDDTHWNGLGTEAIATQVAEALRGDPGDRERTP